MKHYTFDIGGMSCAACANRVEKAVSKLDGTSNVAVNLLKNSMVVDLDEIKISPNDVISAIENAGYIANIPNEIDSKDESISSPQKDKLENKEYKQTKKRLFASIIFCIPLFYISMGHMFNWPLPSLLLGMENAMSFALVQFLLLIPIAIINKKFFVNGFKNLAHLSPNMDSLVALGASAAIVYGIYAMFNIGYGLGHADMVKVHSFMMDLYFESAGTILTLITVGKTLEAKAKAKTTDAISGLMDLAPKKATILRDDQEAEINAQDIVEGDILIIKTGERIAVDCEIIDGTGSFDESALTGESIPVDKKTGNQLLSASVCVSGFVKAKATRVGKNTTLSQIIKLVDEATNSKAPIVNLADKVSGVFVPVVIVISLISIIVWIFCGQTFEFALSIGISVLVISCPCALGLATPTAIMVGTGKGATLGILIKSAGVLESAGKIDTVVMDKTGTITNGTPEITKIICYEGDEEAILKYAYAIESLSEHPLSKAICEYALNKNVEKCDTTDFKQIAGEGISGIVKGEQIKIGNMKMMQNASLNTSKAERDYDELCSDGQTPLFVAINEKLVGIISLADLPRDTSNEAISLLEGSGLETYMLTGDNNITAMAVAKKVGIGNIISDVLPNQKEEKISMLKMQGKFVAFVGDGINDAPALARADVGLAVAKGTDVALDSADIVLMKNDLRDVSIAIELSKATLRNIKQNLFWALAYNSICIPVAAGLFYALFGLKLNPMIAALAMSFSSIFVVGNALRLRTFRPKQTNSYIAKEPEQIINSRKKEEKMTKVLSIEGMMCSHCEGRVKEALQSIPGVEDVNINLDEKIATVSSVNPLDDNTLKTAVEDAGYEVVKIS